MRLEEASGGQADPCPEMVRLLGPEAAIPCPARKQLRLANRQLENLREEIHALQAALRAKTEELERARGELEHVLETTEAATLFLDRHLVIRSFSPAMAVACNLVPSDLGRRLQQLPGNMEWLALAQDACSVLERLAPIEREVRIPEEHRCRLMRILPYQGITGTVEGVVMSLAQIGERTWAEETDSLLSAIVDCSDDAIITKNLDGVIRSWNAGAEKIFGYRPAEIIGSPASVLVPPQLRDEEEQILHRLASGGRIDHLETVRLAKDGRNISVSVSISPIRDGKGRIIGASKILRDITERNQAADQLNRSTARLNLLAEIAHDLLASDTPQEAVESLCRRVMQFLECDAFFNFLMDAPKGRLRLHACAGVPPEEVQKEGWLDAGMAVCGGAAPDCNRIVAENILETQDPGTEMLKPYGIKAYACHALTARGRLLGTLSFGTRSRTSFTEEELSLMKAVADQLAIAMEHECSEEALRQSEKRLRIALASAKAGSWEWDPHRNESRWSDETWRLYGLLPQSRSVSFPEWLQSVHPEDRPRAQAVLQKAAKEGRGVSAEWRVSSPDQETHWLMTRGRPDRDRDGNVVRYSGIVIDITQQKRYEQELVQARQVAEEANRTKSRFLSNMSHELRTPMTGVLGMLEIALEEGLADKQRERIELALRSAASLLRIIDDILDLTQAESGKLSIEEKPFPLRECLRETVEMFLPETRNKGIDLFCVVEDEVPAAVLGDRFRLMQVLSNLVHHAVTRTEKGAVTVEVFRGETDAAGSVPITFSVTDTGIGIPAARQETMFLSFNQADTTHTRRCGGTGLAISKEIIERMGGAIAVVSEEGVGSTFRYTVPLRICAEPDRPAGGGGPKAPRPTDSAHILVAEDDETTRRILGIVLQRCHFDLDFAHDGKSAVQMWEQGRYDLIIMDGQMPVMDGFEATEQIRAREKERGGHVPIVAMTAHALRKDKERCLAAGMDSYVSKPIDIKRCVEVIQELLRKRRSDG